jgi:signal transduction histidine kinase
MKKQILIFLLIACNFLFSQNKNETLYKELIELDKSSKNKDKNIELKLKHFFEKFEENENDSLKGFYYLIRSNTFSDQLKKEEAINSIILSNQFYTKAKNSSGISKSFMNLGNLYLFKGDSEKALIYYNKGLEIAEKNNLYKQVGLINKNIGIVFMNQEKYKEALSYSNIALNMFLKIDNKKEIAGAYINIGNVYFNQYDADNALQFYKKAEKICLEINDNFNLGLIYNNIGSVYAEDKKDKVNGLKYLKKALQYKIANNGTNEIIFQHTNLADFYTNNNDFVNAEYHLKKAELMALKSNNKVELKQIYSIYANTFAKKNDFKSALFNFKLHTKYKDSILNIESLKSVKEIETKYQTAQKEKLILQQQTESKQKNIWLILISSIATIGLLLFRQQRLKSRQQKEQSRLENELLQEQSNFKIQEQRLEISRELHDSVGSQLTFIISILDNLKNAPVKLENAIEKKIDNLSGYANNSISELRDTIWALNTDNLTISELETRILNFVKEASESVETIHFDFKNNSVTNFQLTSKQGINLFRVVQEAVNNAVKHSKASQINIILDEKENQLSMKIQDNGQGFDYEEKRKKSYGLTNLQNRIKELNGDFEVISNQNGTAILISIPISK